MSPSRSLWFAFALGLVGCGQLWKPFLEPTPDTCTGLFDCLQPIICADGSCTGGQDAGPGDAQPSGMDWVPQTSPTTADLFAVWMASRQVAYAGGAGGVTLSINADGRGWQPVAAPPTGTIRSIYGTSLANIWFMGDLGQGLRRTSTNWIVTNPCTPTCSNNFLGIWAKDDFSAITVGSSSAVYTHNNQNWSHATTAQLPGTNFTAVSGLPSGDIYIASDTKSILHRKSDSGIYTQLFGPVMAPRYRRAIWAVSATEVWLAGDRGEVDIFDGAGTFPRDVPTTLAAGARINGLTGNSRGDLWAVGDSGLILHRLPNGTWQREPSHVGTNLFAVSVPADSDQPTIVGGRGTILHRLPVP